MTQSTSAAPAGAPSDATCRLSATPGALALRLRTRIRSASVRHVEAAPDHPASATPATPNGVTEAAPNPYQQ